MRTVLKVAENCPGKWSVCRDWVVDGTGISIHRLWVVLIVVFLPLFKKKIYLWTLDSDLLWE